MPVVPGGPERGAWDRLGELPAPDRTVFQRIRNATAISYSQHLYNEKSPEARYQPARGHSDLFALLDDADLEDVVGLYLQKTGGYLVYPSSCKKDTAAYEFLMRNPTTKEEAGCQVKSGDAEATLRSAGNLPKFFVFAACERYVKGDAPDPNVVVVRRPDLEEFLEKEISIMPARIQHWHRWLRDRDRP